MQNNHDEFMGNESDNDLDNDSPANLTEVPGRSLEGDDKRSPLLRWLQDAQDAEQDNAVGTSRHHGCNSHGLPRGHDGMQITVGVLALHLAHTLPPRHKVCGQEMYDAFTTQDAARGVRSSP